MSGASNSKGMGTPGGMIKVTDYVVVRVPFPRQVFPVAEPTKGGGLRTRLVVRYLYGGTWIDADTLLTRWQPWREIVIEPSRGAGTRSVVSATGAGAEAPAS